jgi:peptide subunit release factor 1 (eRF1)
MLHTTDVNQLLSLDRSDVLSLYLTVDPTLPDNQRTPPGWRIWLKTALDGLRPADHAGAMTLRHLTEALDQQLTDYRAQGKGLAVFLSDGLWQTFDLPVPVPNQLSLGRPDVAPLLWLLDEYKRYGIVQVDHREARLLTAYLGRPEQRGGFGMLLDTSHWHRKDLVSASAGDEYERRVAEYVRAFWRTVADAVVSWADAAHLQRLVLGGDDEAVSAVQSLLPANLVERIAGTLSLPFAESETQVLERARPVAEAFERRQEATLVGEIVTTALKGGRAALGVEDVLGALQRGQVMTVAAAWPVNGTVWRCAGCGITLAEDAGRCPSCGGPLAAEPLEVLLPVMARRTDATLELVYGAAADQLAEHGRLGAALRY